MDRSLRRWNTKKKTSNRLKYLYEMYSNNNLVVPKNRLGRCKKHHPYDCGNAKCWCCHIDKILKLPTPQQKRSDIYLEEWEHEEYDNEI